MIQDALRPHKVLRFGQEIVHNDNQKINTVCINKYKSKWFYNELLKQKAVKAKAVKQWTEYFDIEAEWYQVYINKLKNQLEMKIAEFNYKLISNFLPTGCNLFKWKKAPNESCIYCKNKCHDAQHLLFLAPIYMIYGT